MPKRTIVPRAERIRRGEYPGLNVTGTPGQITREVWIQFVKNPGPRTDPMGYAQRTHPVKYKLTCIYGNVINYLKDKLKLREETDPRNEFIKGIELKV